MAVITIVELELAINRARALHPPVNYVLHPSVNAMAEVYGRMIYQRASLADLDTMPAAIRDEIMRWLMPTVVDPTPAEVESQQICYSRPGGSGFEACEACQ